jgi:hypothetical protein
MRYIELNPVRATMVEHTGEYKWSSYKANAQGEADALISPHPLYLELGSTDLVRQEAYRELFRHHVDNNTLHEIRKSLNHELVLGRSYFKDKIEELTNRQTRLGAPGRPYKVEDEQSIYLVKYWYISVNCSLTWFFPKDYWQKLVVAKNIGLVDQHFTTDKVEVHGNEFLLYRTKQSKDVWQFRLWSGTEQTYIRKSSGSLRFRIDHYYTSR